MMDRASQCLEPNDRRRSSKNPPRFLITIDTEGDNLWARPKTITTENARFLPRFHVLCESYGFKPTYLTNYEMAICPIFQEFGKDVLSRRAGEIGMHLHAWNSPPLLPLTSDDFQTHPYLIEYPRQVMEQKIAAMTDLLEQTFSTKMISHRAGRWGFNETYAQILAQHGYRVDCSVVPQGSYKKYLGDPQGQGGTDFTYFPNKSYFLHKRDISRSGDSPILEIPVTTVQHRRRLFLILSRLFSGNPTLRDELHRKFPVKKFIPNGSNRKKLIHIVDYCRQQKRTYLELMLHSSELMPNGSPKFKTERSIEMLFEDLECVFEIAKKTFVGSTLGEFYRKVTMN